MDLSVTELHSCDSSVDDIDLTVERGENIPDTFARLTQLKRLRVRGDHVTELPKSLWSLPALEELEFSCDRLPGLGDDVSSLPNLWNLKIRTEDTFAWPPGLAKLGLRALTVHGVPVPDAAWQLPLEELHLVRNGREGLYEEIRGLASTLRVLHMQYNKTPQLPTWIGELQELRDLDFGFIQLEHLPDELCQLRELERLGLYMSKIRGLPKNIGDLVKLEKLIFAGSKIEGFPDSLSMLKSVREIRLYSNPLHVFPDGFFPHPSLEVLDLNSCRGFESLPEGIGASPKLRELNLSWDEQIESVAALEACVSLEKLDLEYGPKGELHVLGTCTGLRELSLGKHDELVDISWIESCIKLEKLDLEDCRALKKPEKSLAKLTSLRVLHASGSSLKDTSALAALPLEELDLNETKVSELHLSETPVKVLRLRECRLKSIAGLPKSLEELDLNGRKLSCDLTPLGQLKNLRILDISDAKCTDLCVLAGCTALEDLDLGRNALSDISWISSLIALRELKLTDNKQLTNLSALGSLPLQKLDVYRLKKADLSTVPAGCEISGP